MKAIEHPLNSKHLAWCRAHDWGRNAELHFGRIDNLLEVLVTPDGERVEKYLSFGSFQAIRDWAGY